MNNRDRIVSSESEELILVDSDDNELGFASKAACHDGGGMLHRAFSLFLFNDKGELLLQRRAAGKRLWPGYWSNSCCSHPRRGESMRIATERRLDDELNIGAQLTAVYSFEYQADFGKAGAENELCHVYVGSIDGDVHPNTSEIDEVRYLSCKDLNALMQTQSEIFTPWFKQEWSVLNSEHSETLSRYAI